MLEIFKPFDVGVPLKRYGNDYDGGYVIADSLNYDCILSGGAGTNITFEEAIRLSYPEITMAIIDPSVGYYKNINDIDFVPKNITDKVSENSDNLHRVLGQIKNAFVKLDIEGSEFEWLEALPISLQKNIKQLVIEFHGSVQAIPYIKQLQQTHTIINIHGNNYGSWCNIDGKSFPDVIEVTFLRKSDCKYFNQGKPSKLNQPNNPHKQEINLD
jgi:hypothetical protein